MISFRAVFAVTHDQFSSVQTAETPILMLRFRLCLSFLHLFSLRFLRLRRLFNQYVRVRPFPELISIMNQSGRLGHLCAVFCTRLIRSIVEKLTSNYFSIVDDTISFKVKALLDDNLKDF